MNDLDLLIIGGVVTFLALAGAVASTLHRSHEPWSPKTPEPSAPEPPLPSLQKVESVPRPRRRSG